MNWRPAFLRRRDRERELDDELKFHLEEQIKDHVAAGLTPDEARRQAALEFGGLAQVKENCRDERPTIVLEQLGADLRFAARQLRQAPAFAAAAICTVAIGIGACTALFSVVNGVLLRPLPLPEPDRVVLLEETRPPDTVLPLAPAVYLDWVKQSSAFEAIALAGGRPFNSTSAGHAVRFFAQNVTANFFQVVGVQPLLGRGFRPEEEIIGNDHVVVLSYRTWQNDFGGRKNVINETMLLDDQPFTIVGVLPDHDLVWNASLFTPHTFSVADRTDYGSHGWGCIARLKPGVSLDAARDDLARVSENIARAHPDSNKDHGAHLSLLLEAMTGPVRLQLLVLLGAVGFLLLIACVNVASLLLARASARGREIAVRAALGASRGRIVRQFLSESLLIAVAGGGLGTLLAYAAMGSLARFAGSYVPRTDQFVIDGRVVAVTLGLVLASGLGVGLVLAWQTARGDMLEALKDASRGSGGRKRQRLRTGLVIVEIALALMLLAGTGLLARSLRALQRADQGFKTENVYVGELSLGSGRRYDSADKTAAFVNEIIARTQALPDVHSLAFSTGLPMAGTDGLLFVVAGSPEVPITAMPSTNASSVTEDYFKAMSIPLVQGRTFTAQDGPGAPRVVIINEKIAQKYFPGKNPVGQRLMILTMADKPDVEREIVGVVGDVRPFGPQSGNPPQVYEPLAQRPMSNLNVILRTTRAATTTPVALTEIIRSLDGSLPFQSVHAYDGTVAGGWFRQRFSMILFTLFSTVALGLAAIGIYGVMAYAVAQRTHEIGIRMALGAGRTNVLRLVLRGGLGMVLAGVAVGLTGALAFGRVLGALMFETSPTDPLTLLAVAALLAVVALLACWIPALRATRIEPVVALRSE